MDLRNINSSYLTNPQDFIESFLIATDHCPEKGKHFLDPNLDH